jgi:hypothetical protein
MNAPSGGTAAKVRRAAAVAIVLAALLFGGSHVARSVVRDLTAPLASLERLAQRPPVPILSDDPLPEWEISGDPETVYESPLRVEGRASVRTPAPRQQRIADSGARLVELLEYQTAEIEVKANELLYFVTQSVEWGSDQLAQLERDLNLSSMQRERIERWLAWKKEALAALGETKHPTRVREIEESTAEAVRAELDFFQAQEFDQRRQGGRTFLTLAMGSVTEVGRQDRRALIDYSVADQPSLRVARKTRVALKTAE